MPLALEALLRDSLAQHSASRVTPPIAPSKFDGILAQRSVASSTERIEQKKPANVSVDGLFGRGGGEETRTPDPLHAKQVLYQLSYTPTDRRGF